jgi:transcriptional regulator with XRE-family HTH domain
VAERSAPGIRRRQLAIRLTELRKTRRMTHDEVAEWTGMSQAVISKIENARQRIQKRHILLLAQCYNVTAPQLDTLLRMAMESNQRGLLVAHGDTAPDFARQYFELEQYAAELWVYEPAVVFGLVQTTPYITALTAREQPTASTEELARSVSLRQARQSVLSTSTPPQLRLVLDEAVLHRSVGDASVMAGQLRYLIDMSHSDHVRLRIVPFAQGVHPAVGMGFTVLRFDDDPPGMDVVYVEHVQSAAYHEKPAELARYVAEFEAITAAALPEDESRELLTTLIGDLWEQPRKGQE